MTTCKIQRTIFCLLILCIFFPALSVMAQTTAPSITDPQKEIQDLKAQVADLLKANASLRAANDGLKKRIEAITHPPAAAVAPRLPYQGTTFTKRTTDYVNRTNLRSEDRATILSIATSLDKGISAYVKKNLLDKEAEAALYAGEIKLGMSEDELKLMGNLTVNLETESGKSCSEEIWEANHPLSYRITIVEGKVSTIDHTGSAGSSFSSKEIHAGQSQ